MQRIVTIATLALAIAATSVKAAPPKTKSAAVVVASAVEAPAPVVEAPAVPAGPTPLEQIYIKREEQKVLNARLNDTFVNRWMLLGSGTLNTVAALGGATVLAVQAITPASEDSSPILIATGLSSAGALLCLGAYVLLYGDTTEKALRVDVINNEIDAIVAPVRP